MKATSQPLPPPPPEFTPIRLTIDIETPEELITLFNLGNNNISSAAVVAGRAAGTYSGPSAHKAPKDKHECSQIIAKALFYPLKTAVQSL